MGDSEKFLLCNM